MTHRSMGRDIAPRHVLVLGGAGFLGSVLVRRLLERRYTVTVYDSFVYDRDSLEGIEADDFFAVVRGDVRDRDRLRGVIEGKDVVVDLAAIVGDAGCDVDPAAAREINADCARDAYRMAHEAGVERFVFASTCSVYGYGENILDESSFLNPVSLYAQTKLTGELLLLADRHRHRTALSILRFATLFGWSWRPRFDLVVNTMTGHALSRGAVTVMGGNQWRPHLHVRDAAEAILRVIEAPRDAVDCEIFNAGGNALNMTVRELGETIARLVPGCRLETRPEAIDPRNYLVDFGKIRQRLDFVPRFGIADGVREITEAARRAGLERFDAPRFSNVAVLRALHERAGRTTDEAAVPAR